MAIANGDEALRMAIEICTMRDFKNYFMYVWMDDAKRSKIEWNKNLGVFLSNFFEKNFINKNMHESVTGIVFCIAFRMKTWLEHHVGVLKLNREFCLSLLTPGIFTEKGIIDCKKTINLVENVELSSDKRFRLSSWHCLKKQSAALFDALGEDKSIFYNDYNPENIHETHIIKYWAFYSEGRLDLLKKEPEVEVSYPGNLYNKPLRSVNIEDIKRDTSVNKLMLNSAISSGSETAINYCLDQLGRKKDLLPEILIDIVIYRMKLGNDLFDPNTRVVDDWVVFRCPNYSITREIWVPSHYIVDTFYFMFSKINDDEIWKIPPRLKDRINLTSKVRKSYQLFDYFLCWPHQDLFIKFVNSCWNHIPYEYFGTLLLSIFERIEPAEDTLYYGENKAFDYGKMFTEFWRKSPDNFKRYVFENVKCVNNFGKKLLLKMIYEKAFFTKHLMIIIDFLNEATINERKNLVCSTDGDRICDFLLEENFDFLDELIKMCTESDDEARKFITILNVVRRCLESIKVGDFSEAENTLSSLEKNDKEVNEIKERIICCDKGIKLCTDFGFENAERFINFVQWCEMDSSRKTNLRRALLKKGRSLCLSQAIEAPEKADQFLKLCYSLEEKTSLQINLSIKKFKRDLAKGDGISFCKSIVVKEVFIPNIPTNLAHIWAETQMWARLYRIDNFIKWCFSYPQCKNNDTNEEDQEEANKKIEVEMNKYKGILFKHANHDINYQLIKSARFYDVSIFYFWAGCTSEDVRIFIKNKLFDCSRTAGLFCRNMDLKMLFPEDEKIIYFIMKMLGWCLVDGETVHAFNEKFNQYKDDPLIKYITFCKLQNEL